RPRLLSSRTKITKVDELMKPIFDDFLGLEQNGIVGGILKKVGADSLAQLLQDKQTGKQISKEEMVAALTTANKKLEQYAENIYQDKISPLIFYIGCTGLLPDQIEAKAMTAEEAAAKYPDLQFSKDEQEGTFFAIGDSMISIYAKTEYYSKLTSVCIDN
ncbi:MAG: VWA domain-containing protein, partial [Nostoc sp.]